MYRDSSACPLHVPVFPLPRALLLPRGQIPLNIFEPRYVALVDTALATDRVIGMVQPIQAPSASERANEGIISLRTPTLMQVGTLGRITEFSETGDGRYSITLTGVSRFRVIEEIETATPFRRCHVAYDDFTDDFLPHAGEEKVDRARFMQTFRRYADTNSIKVDWRGLQDIPIEALVNALAMMAPFGSMEKQALLEAQTLGDRAELLMALAEIDLARGGSETIN
jgi:uncharacterized protein